MDDKNLKNYRFPDIDARITFTKLIAEEKKLRAEEKKISRFTMNDITPPGAVFDVAAFNKQVDKIFTIKRKRKKIKDKIQLLKIQYTPLNYNKLSIGEMKHGLVNDLYDMLQEIKDMEKNKTSLNEIFNKNYRKVTILFIILLIVIISYSLIKYLKK